VYEEYGGGKVYLNDDCHLRIVGCGRVLIRFPDGRVKGINGFFHILSFVQNLLLVGTLNDAGLFFFFSNGGCKMVKGDMVHTKGVCVGPILA